MHRIDTNEIPAIEVKNVHHFVGSIHEDGYPYEFIRWVENQALYDEFPEHIDHICKKYGLQYLDGNGRGIGDIPITELFKADTVIYEGNNRHLLPNIIATLECVDCFKTLKIDKKLEVALRKPWMTLATTDTTAYMATIAATIC